MKIQVRVPHAPPIAVQPAMELREWRVLEDVDAELLLIGLHVDSDRVRISTPVLSWDYGQRTWATQSGRVYRTVSPPGEFLTPERIEGLVLARELRGPMIDWTEVVWAEMELLSGSLASTQ
ncbi:MAG TPA: hypothetical protein H9903_18475 [Candidatus Aquabacterium excrementipullorum]|nr:hypothetical protein [Candidatus Aquabacterium excrementipullorum]